VEVSEGDVDGDEHDVGRVAEEVTPELDSLAEDKRPQGQGDKEGLSLIGWPRLRCLVPRVEDEAVVRKSPCGDSCLEYGIGAPGLSPVLRLVTGKHWLDINSMLTTSNGVRQTSWSSYCASCCEPIGDIGSSILGHPPVSSAPRPPCDIAFQSSSRAHTTNE